jgi:hypothetical protein
VRLALRSGRCERQRSDVAGEIGTPLPAPDPAALSNQKGASLLIIVRRYLSNAILDLSKRRRELDDHRVELRRLSVSAHQRA